MKLSYIEIGIIVAIISIIITGIIIDYVNPSPGSGVRDAKWTIPVEEIVGGIVSGEDIPNEQPEITDDLAV